MTKYFMIFSHGVVQSREFDIPFLLQPELLIDKVESLLSFLHSFYLCLLKLIYAKSCLFLSLLMLSLDSLKNK